jgi:hypothetical protein
VGPDNGLLLPALGTLGGPGRAVELQDHGYWLPSKGQTFAGRDVFAPAAVHLVAGGDISDLGAALDPTDLVRLPPLHRRCRPDGLLEAEVTWVDRFGNVQLAAGADDLAAVLAGPGRRARKEARGDGEGPSRVTSVLHTQLLAVSSGAAGASAPGLGAAATSRGRVARVVNAYAELAEEELGILVDSCGCLALSLNGASAAKSLGTNEGDYVFISRPATTSRGSRAAGARGASRGRRAPVSHDRP